MVTNGEWINEPEDQTGNAEWEQRIKQMLRDIMDRFRVPKSGAVTESCSFQKITNFPHLKTNGNLQLERLPSAKEGKQNKTEIKQNTTNHWPEEKQIT